MDEFDKLVNDSIGKGNMNELLRNGPDIHWDVNDKGQRQKTINNTLNFFLIDDKLKNLFRFNEFTSSIEFSMSPGWDREKTAGSKPDDGDLIEIKYHLSNNHRFDIGTDKIFEAVVKASNDNRYHPIKNYLQGLVWDKTPRIDTWLIRYTGCEDNSYTRSVGQIILLAAITRIYNPGCKFDYLAILEGSQGIGKSTLLRHLGHEWFGDINILARSNDKDCVDAMRSKWIVEVSELAFFKQAEVENIKAFLSRPVDTIRLAYDRLTKDFPRKSILIATYNPSSHGYLKDATGNRRFWPIPCTNIDNDGFLAVRDQLWAEAFAVFKKGGFKLWLNDEDEKIALSYQISREVQEPWTDYIEDWLLEPQNLNKSYLLAKEIAKDALNIDPGRVTPMEYKRIANALRQLGWVNSSKRIDGHKTKVYVRLEEKEETWQE